MNEKTFHITRDKSASLKALKLLERAGKIIIHEVQLENVPHLAKQRSLPVGIVGHSIIGECVVADTEIIFTEICNIIGNNNIKDAMTLETHIRNEFDIFVTEDTDEFIKGNRRLKLESRFTNLKIMTTSELIQFLS